MLSFELQIDNPAEGGQTRTRLGESPVWDAVGDAIWWVDIEGRGLLRLDLTTKSIRRWQTPEMPGFVVLLGPSQPVLGMQSGLFTFDPAQTSFDLLLPLDRESIRFNDATIDPSGRLWTSTMSIDAHPEQGAIQMLDNKGQLRTIITGLTIPNGMAAHPDNDHLYFSDSHPDMQMIWTLPLSSTPDQNNATVFASTRHLNGRPDGAVLDAAGNYWIAGVDGGELYCFDTNGHVTATIAVPFPAPTKLMFYGPDARSIAVTSKDHGEKGGYLAQAQLPDDFAAGSVQPYWTRGVPNMSRHQVRTG